MSQAKRNDNHVATLRGVSIDDLRTPEMLAVDPDNNRLLVQPNFQLGVNFDYIGIENTSATVDTLTFKLGGSGGITARTMVVTYAVGASKISDDLVSLDVS